MHVSRYAPQFRARQAAGDGVPVQRGLLGGRLMTVHAGLGLHKCEAKTAFLLVLRGGRGKGGSAVRREQQATDSAAHLGATDRRTEKAPEAIELLDHSLAEGAACGGRLC